MSILKRLSDGKGDSGARTEALKYNKNSKKLEVVGNKPTLGCSLLVGSVTARSYSNQDYWLTTEITEILEETDNYVKFKTLNSIYEWFN